MPRHFQHLLEPTALADDELRLMLEPLGFSDWRLAHQRLLGLTKDPTSRAALGACLPMLLDVLANVAAPDSSLMNFERFLQSVPQPLPLLNFLSEHPRAVEVLVKLFTSSQFLTDILLRNPNYLQELTEHKRLAEFKAREEFADEALRLTESRQTLPEKLDALRRHQHWELLRIGACDTFGLMDFKSVTLQLSLLADGMTQAALQLLARELSVPMDDFCVLAFGKLGGEELNYSSDIDLVFVCRNDAARYWGLGQKLIRALMDTTSEGFLYRVDMRLRPWGKSGALVCTLSSYLEYLQSSAQLWERQALLKARPIAGSLSLGHEFLRSAEPTVFATNEDDARQNVRSMKGKIEAELIKKGKLDNDVKSGRGSIRDIEFLTQFLQLKYGRQHKAVRTANTLEGLIRLADFEFILPGEYRRLTAAYVLFRTIEHALQLMHNEQEHALPNDERELAYLAGRLDFPSAAAFLTAYQQHRDDVRKIYERYIELASLSELDADRGSKLPPHANLMEPSYAKVFLPEQIELHAVLLSRLSAANPIEINVAPTQEDRWQLTVCGFDQKGDLSMMCGLLLAYGFDIVLANVFTAEQVSAAQSQTREPSSAVGNEKRSGVEKPTKTSRRRTTNASEAKRFVNVFVLRPTVVSGNIAALDERSLISPSSRTRESSDSENAFGSLTTSATGASRSPLKQDPATAPRSDPADPNLWSAFHAELTELVALAARGQLREAQGRVASRVAARLRGVEMTSTSLLPINVDINNEQSERFTTLHISAEDTPGFLYELTNALALVGFDIHRVIAASLGNRAVDTVHILDPRGQRVTEPSEQARLRAAIAFIKHFTHLLPQSSNPEAALLHFGQFVERLFDQPDWASQLASLDRSPVLEALARLLGVSEFLWEDFLRLQYDNLIPVLHDIEGLEVRKTRAALSLELEQLLHTVPNDAALSAARRDLINAFKDREMFRADLRHIIGRVADFNEFSQELTDIAESVVAALLQECLLHVPQKQNAKQTAFVPRVCVLALGKFGGCELGFASDIELMFVYDSGNAVGSSAAHDLPSSDVATVTSVALSDFYGRVVEEFSNSITARRKGIFEIDLRLRPYGSAGPLAVSLESFINYFGPSGPAWPYERQALVKLRPIAGHQQLGQAVIEWRDQFVYGERSFDLAAMRAMRERQLRQLVERDTFNAKLGAGGLVDCEYLVQGLQITFGREHSELRTPNTNAAIDALRHAGHLSDDEHQALKSAYGLLRRVIDALRMVRGDARDLNLPPIHSSEFRSLAMRTGYGANWELLVTDLEATTARVMSLSRALSERM